MYRFSSGTNDGGFRRNFTRTKVSKLQLVHQVTLSLTVKFGPLKDLDFSDEDVVERVDGLTLFLYVLANAVRNPEEGETNTQ